MRHEDADNALADALWWFRGFRAAQPTEASDATFDMQSKLLDARNWLKRLAEGKRRVLGLGEPEQGIVITYAEFERLYDGLRHGIEDREVGVATAKQILEEYRAELRGTKPGVPF
ncbi:hypothetical protein HNO88_003003 [Novosphingobium chloroacetimidivorans]|uniref:Uncharacterized protein n=1 Tax=Novosphingobium chloroacetimidivorans TaxID=1428314 RepID=A0A7W7KCC6_9SPHN|nr:hypothetical protein [Novosphingobium chloroacetimidivorans]MBB4859674.1 hypothetical protein [Novosphingobium chloroacetimidivorans]